MVYKKQPYQENLRRITSSEITTCLIRNNACMPSSDFYRPLMMIKIIAMLKEGAAARHARCCLYSSVSLLSDIRPRAGRNIERKWQSKTS